MINFVRRNDTPNRQGRYAVRMRITKETQRKYFALKMFADDEDWDVENECFRVQRDVRGERQKVDNERRKQHNYILNRYRTQAQEIIDDFRRERIDWTLNQFADAFFNKGKQGKVKPYWENHIRTLRETGHLGNADVYMYTLRMLDQYDKQLEKRMFSEIDIKYVRGFDLFLQKRGCCGNTRKHYFRPLRAILNKAIQEKEATDRSYPFGKGGFQVGQLDEETEKRYLTVEYLDKLKNTRSAIPQNEYARKLFLLSFYCLGMSFIDMALLTNDNIRKYNGGDYIVYVRHKLKNQKKIKPIKILITDEIRNLLDSLKEGSPTMDNFIVPIVSVSGYKDEKLYYHIRNRYHKYNNYLADLAKELGMSRMPVS